MGSLEGAITLDEIVRIKARFDEVEEEWPDGIDLEVFITEFGPLLGPNLTRLELKHLFMKIDADSNGNIDWDELSNYMFLDNKTEQVDNEAYVLKMEDFPIEDEELHMHKTMCSNMLYIPGGSAGGDKYCTCGTDGTFKLWDAEDLKPFKTCHNTTSWITHALFLPVENKLCLCAVDRSLSFYEIKRNTFTLSGRVFLNGSWGTPMCLGLMSGPRFKENNSGGQVLMFGDDTGAVKAVKTPTTSFNPAVKRELSSNEVVTLHRKHTDWVTRVMYLPDVNSVVSSSLDGTVLLVDPETRRLKLRMNIHSQGVYGLAFTGAYTMIASHGTERDIQLWHAITGRKMGVLLGHQSSVQSVFIHERHNQLISISTDKTVKLWDLRINKCLMTLVDDRVYRPENRIACAMYDLEHRYLLKEPLSTRNKLHHAPRWAYSAAHQVWPHVSVILNNLGHAAPVGHALYNVEFDYVVSADDEGMVFVWNINTGARIGKFSTGEGTKISAICFDNNTRRLVVANTLGEVNIFNYNNGANLKTFVHEEDMSEVSGLLYVVDEQREEKMVMSVGWNKKIIVWEELEEEEEIEDYRVFDGHKEDILCCAFAEDPFLLATGDYGGNIFIWTAGGIRRKELLHKALDSNDSSVEKLLFLSAKRDSMGNAMLMSAGADGFMRLWELRGYNGKLRTTFRGAHGKVESVSALSTDKDNTVLIAGDTAGHVRVWDISQIDLVPESATHSAIRTVTHFRPSKSGLSSVEYVDKYHLVVVASLDHTVSLWTTEGALLGYFGVDTWALGDRKTWKDPTGARTPQVQPLEEVETTRVRDIEAEQHKLQVNLAKGGQRGVGSMGGHRKLKRLSSSLDQPTVSQRVMQILKESKAAYKRGGKNGFNVEEYVSKQKIRLHTHLIPHVPDTVTELRTLLDREPGENGLLPFRQEGRRLSRLPIFGGEMSPAMKRGGFLTPRGPRMPPMAGATQAAPFLTPRGIRLAPITTG